MNLTIIQVFENSESDIPITAVATLKEVGRLVALGHTVQVIFIDNGSTDASPSLLEGVMESLPSGVLVLYRDNLGASTVRNAAIGVATGDYILMLHGNVAVLAVSEQLAEYLQNLSDCLYLGFAPDCGVDNPALANSLLPSHWQSGILENGRKTTLLCHYGMFPVRVFRRGGARFDEAAPYASAGAAWADRDMLQQLVNQRRGKVHIVRNVGYHLRKPTVLSSPEARNGHGAPDEKRVIYYYLKWHNELSEPE